MPSLKLTKRALTNISDVSSQTIFYDTDLTGFGLKVMPSGAQSWIIEYRPGAGGRSVSKRRLVIGTPKTLTPEEARKAAGDLLARAKLGADPAAERRASREAETVIELLERFMADHVRPKRKPRTNVLFEGYIKNHLAPALGTKKAVILTRSDVAKFHKALGAERPVTANRVLALLGSAFVYGAKHGILPISTANPAIGIERFREESRERYLSVIEMLRLGDAIREAETVGIPWEPDPAKNTKHAPNPENRVTLIGPHAAAALRLLIFTGARLREILDLRWEHVDLQRGFLFLPDSKTGKKTIVLGAPALVVLTNLPRVGDYVIAGDKLDKPRADLQRPWALVSKRAGLDGLRLHDLRHSFASVGAGSGLGLPIIGKLLGHANAETTERYAHLAADPLRRGADMISNQIAKAMGETS